jgi:hypothetical protein
MMDEKERKKSIGNEKQKTKLTFGYYFVLLK